MNERYIKRDTPRLTREFGILAFCHLAAVSLTKHWPDDSEGHGHERNYWQDVLPHYLLPL